MGVRSTSDGVTIHDVADPLDGDGYRDVRHSLRRYELVECWNCGHEHFDGPSATQRLVCEECLMGQRAGNEDSKYATDGGYIDFGRLWYGDLPREEMRRRFKRSAKRGPAPNNVVVRI